MKEASKEREKKKKKLDPPYDRRGVEGRMEKAYEWRGNYIADFFLRTGILLDR